MNFLLVLLVLLMLLSLTDFMLYKNKSFHTSMYQLAFLLAFFFFSIKYYYGPDILWYVPIYDDTPTLSMICAGVPIDSSFEVGFNYFWILCRSLGLSYWGMTFVVNLLYFIAIAQLFKKLNVRSVLPLFLLVLLDFNLLMAQHRQCLSVTFFIFMFLSAHKRHYIRMTLFMILSVLMHKAGIFCAFVSYFLLLNKFRVSTRTYQVLAVFALLFLFVPIHYYFLLFAELLHLDPMVIHSLEFHFSYMKRIQTIILFYAMVYYCFCVYKNKPLIFQQMDAICLVGILSITIFYSYFPILGRIRAYYTPFLLAYIFYALQNQNDESKVQIISKVNAPLYRALRGVVYSVLFFYGAYSIRVNYVAQNLYKSKIYESSTVFDLFHYSAQEIKERQLAKSEYYWYQEYQQQIVDFKIEN